MQPVFWKAKIPADAEVGRPYRLCLKASVRLRIREREQFPQSDAVLYMLW